MPRRSRKTHGPGYYAAVTRKNGTHTVAGPFPSADAARGWARTSHGASLKSVRVVRRTA